MYQLLLICEYKKPRVRKLLPRLHFFSHLIFPLDLSFEESCTDSRLEELVLYA